MEYTRLLQHCTLLDAVEGGVLSCTHTKHNRHSRSSDHWSPGLASCYRWLLWLPQARVRPISMYLLCIQQQSPQLREREAAVAGTSTYSLHPYPHPFCPPRCVVEQCCPVLSQPSARCWLQITFATESCCKRLNKRSDSRLCDADYTYVPVNQSFCHWQGLVVGNSHFTTPQGSGIGHARHGEHRLLQYIHRGRTTSKNDRARHQEVC